MLKWRLCGSPLLAPSKPSLQQSNSNNIDKGILFSPLNHCGRVTSAAMAHAIHMARKSKTNQSPQVIHPFSTLDYDTNTHINKTNNANNSNKSNNKSNSNNNNNSNSQQ